MSRLTRNKTYTVASHNYMLKNAGDGINMFTECELLLEDVMLDNQVLITYITEGLGGVVGEEYADPYGQGTYRGSRRITYECFQKKQLENNRMKCETPTPKVGVFLWAFLLMGKGMKIVSDLLDRHMILCYIS